jgi:hypothetical protein
MLAMLILLAYIDFNIILCHIFSQSTEHWIISVTKPLATFSFVSKVVFLSFFLSFFRVLQDGSKNTVGIFHEHWYYVIYNRT